MKLSILIPVYNRNVSSLLNELSAQSYQYPESIEIICLDDGSDLYRQENAETADRLDITYYFSENRGRSASRNQLMKFASGEYLLFLDCDSGIVKEDFINDYMEEIRKKKPEVIYGGRIYPASPSGKGFILHWVYGHKVEAAPLKKREANPYLTFMSNNFVVRKEIFENFPMDEELSRYGYEDLLWALILENNKIPIQHFDNPVRHEDLCSTDVFLAKTKQALMNLTYLVKSNKLESDSTPLLRTYLKLRQLKMLSFFLFFFRFCRKPLEFQLHSRFPIISLFSIWKLGIYAEILWNDRKY